MTAVGITLIVLGAFISASNWATLIESRRSGRHVSVVPLIGAALLGCGFTIIPQTRSYAWTALIADLGTLGLLLSLPMLAFGCWARSRFNLLHFLQSDEPGRHIKVKLFRRNIAIVQGDLNPPMPCDDAQSAAMSFSWSARWRLSGDGFVLSEYGGSRELVIFRENEHFKTRELNSPVFEECRHDCLDGLELKSK